MKINNCTCGAPALRMKLTRGKEKIGGMTLTYAPEVTVSCSAKCGVNKESGSTLREVTAAWNARMKQVVTP